ELVRALRTNPAHDGVGFVLTTTESDQEVVAELKGVARTVLMPKPFELPRLAQALAEATGRATDLTVVLPTQGEGFLILSPSSGCTRTCGAAIGHSHRFAMMSSSLVELGSSCAPLLLQQ